MMLHNFIYSILVIFEFTYCNELNNVSYNTTSGLYTADIIDINGSFVHQIKGIYYAEKPKRFELPQLKSYQGIVTKNYTPISCFAQENYTSYGPMQLKSIPLMVEDCLVINLYIPVVSFKEKLPVMLVIHGGGNVVGSAELFDGSVLASRGGIIIASINYRLFVEGFLSSRTKKYPGNYGLHDQILALKWLKLNCPILNCDPKRITLWGHSAGAVDVMWLTLSPKTNKLFQRAIIQSGSAMNYWGIDLHPEQRYKALRDYFNCSFLPAENDPENKNFELLIDLCLINIEPEKILKYPFGYIDFPNVVIDSNIITVNYSAAELLNANNPIKIDIITGNTALEGFPFFEDFNDSLKFLRERQIAPIDFTYFDQFALYSRDKCVKDFHIRHRKTMSEFIDKKLLEIVNSTTPEEDKLKEELKLVLIDSFMDFDLGFLEFINRFITNKSLSTGQLYVYEFAIENKNDTKKYEPFKRITKKKDFVYSSHFDSLDYIFGLPIAFWIQSNYRTRFRHPLENINITIPYNQTDIEISTLIMSYFSNFVKTGNPNEGTIMGRYWPPYTQNESYLIINENILNNITIGHGLKSDVFDFWFKKLDYHQNCFKENVKIEDISIENCLKELKGNKQYDQIDEEFLQVYDKCFRLNNKFENLNKTSFLGPFCSNIISAARLIEEYKTCCQTPIAISISSTLCYEKFNSTFLNNDTLDKLINLGKEKLNT